MSFDLEDVPVELRPAVEATLKASGFEAGHLAIELVSEDRIRDVNRTHRDRDSATDVLSFPIDGGAPSAGPRELGDVVICPARCGGVGGGDDSGDGDGDGDAVLGSVTEAAVHGVLHLCGYDHEVDDGEMLARQEAVLERLGHRRGEEVRGVGR